MAHGTRQEFFVTGLRMPEVRDRIELAMTECGLSAKELTQRLTKRARKNQQAQVSRWLNKDKWQMPGVENLKAISAVLDGRPWQWFLVGDEGAETIIRWMKRQRRTGRRDKDLVKLKPSIPQQASQ